MDNPTNPPYVFRIVKVGDCCAMCWQVRAVLESGEVIASVKMRTWAECPCVAVVFHLETRLEFRRQGIASAMLAELERLAIRETVSLLLLTVRMDNLPCRMLCRKAGYTEDCAWHNARTDNNLVLGRKVLRLATE